MSLQNNNIWKKIVTDYDLFHVLMRAEHVPVHNKTYYTKVSPVPILTCPWELPMSNELLVFCLMFNDYSNFLGIPEESCYCQKYLFPTMYKIPCEQKILQHVCPFNPIKFRSSVVLRVSSDLSCIFRFLDTLKHLNSQLHTQTPRYLSCPPHCNPDNGIILMHTYCRYM